MEKDIYDEDGEQIGTYEVPDVSDEEEIYDPARDNVEAFI